MKKIGLLGYGYTASYFAQLLVHEGYTVWGTSRKVASLQYALPAGVDIIGFNLDSISTSMLDTSFLLISTPPTDAGFDPSLTLLKDMLIANKSNIQWIGYLSSTGVYGDHQGGWVDEMSACYPNTTRAINRLSAENAWLSLFDSECLPIMIFRLSGIYGPGRNVLERLKAGKNSTVFKQGQYFSRIHVADICQALFQSMLSPMPREIINLTDDCPSSAHEVDCFAADLLQISKPELIPYGQDSLSSRAKEFYQSNRRVSNAKLKKNILPDLKYPSYQEGLKAILSGERFV